MNLKKKKTTKELEQEVVDFFYQDKYKRTKAAILDMELELEYLESSQGKARGEQEIGAEIFRQTLAKEKRTLDSKKSFLNFLKDKI